MFYFLRHGESDDINRNKKIYQGFGVNLLPLSKAGVEQIKAACKDKRLQRADIILSSPYTRAVQTAAILSKELGADIVIETDLHEWLANKNFIYEDEKTAFAYHKAYYENNGKYPDCKDEPWETAEMIKNRVLKVLKKYSHYKKVIVAAHGMMIETVAGCHHPYHAEIIEFEL